jgi:polysaccharide export outer membrane protein
MRRLIGVTVLAALLGVGVVQMSGPARAQEASERKIPEYKLGSGDKVRVITYGEAGLTGEFFVSGDGKVSLPLIGDTNATGLTVPQFQAKIEAALKDGYLKDPKVSVEVLSYRPFYIMGEVKTPGTYPYINGLTVMNAVATAGGFTYRANDHRVEIRRADTADWVTYRLDPTTPVAPGDTIKIDERLF